MRLTLSASTEVMRETVAVELTVLVEVSTTVTVAGLWEMPSQSLGARLD